MRVNIPVFHIEWFAVGAVLWFVAMLGGVGTIAWELEMIRTDQEPQRVEVTHRYEQQPQQRPPFQRKSVEL